MISILPHLNAALNAVAACFLVCGFIFIRNGNRSAHQACMIAAATLVDICCDTMVDKRVSKP